MTINNIRTIPLMIASALLLGFALACHKTSTEKSPISMLIDGELYSSKEYIYKSTDEHDFYLADDEFSIIIIRTLRSDTGHTVDLFFHFKEKAKLEIGEKFYFHITGKEFTRQVYIKDYTDDGEIRYNATEGWILISNLTEDDSFYGKISGEFEFTAVNEDSGETIHVTEGKFDHLHY